MKAIAAMSLNRIIGNKNKIPWAGKFPYDMVFFKSKTEHNSIVMGRKTFESVGLLKNRKTFVITTNKELLAKPTEINEQKNACLRYISVLDFFEEKHHKNPNMWVCGGAEIYNLLIPAVEEVYLTLILDGYKGDTFMPLFESYFRNAGVVVTEDEFLIINYNNE